MTGEVTITEVFWEVRCSCGWESIAPNEAEVVCNKIKTHLLQRHVKQPASLAITSYVEVRPSDKLPALGRLATAPPDVHVLPA